MVLDASVAAKLFLQDDRSDDALALLAGDPDPTAPALILEVMNALWTAVRGRRAPAEILAAAQTRMPALFSKLESDATLFRQAATLMADLADPIYDCLYVAMAQREGATLVTVDERQFAAARKARVPARLL